MRLGINAEAKASQQPRPGRAFPAILGQQPALPLFPIDRLLISEAA